MSEIKEARLQKANSLVNKGFASYAQSFRVSNTTKFLIQKFDYLENGQEEDFSVSLAGRVMAKRVMGKIAFFTISDQEGQIQLYLDKRIINLNLEKQKLLSFEDLKEIVDIMQIETVVGVGKYSKKRAEIALEETKINLKSCWHPSPASPLANKNKGADWRENFKSILPE